MLLSQVLDQGLTQARREKLLPVSIGLDAQGQPLPPLTRKLASLGLTLGENITVSDLQREHDGKQEVLWVDTQVAGARLLEATQSALEASIAGLPIPKLMRYPRPGQTQEEVRFVRPAHRLMALHGDAVLPFHALGLQADRLTEGHRFHCDGPLSLSSADAYEALLEREGEEHVTS